MKVFKPTITSTAVIGIALTIAPAAQAAGGGGVDESPVPTQSAVVAVDPSGDLIRYDMLGGHSHRKPVMIGGGYEDALSVSVIDWNFDGVQDVIAHWPDGRLTMDPGQFNGGFGERSQIPGDWSRKKVVVVEGWGRPASDGRPMPAILTIEPNGDLRSHQTAQMGGPDAQGFQTIGRGWRGYEIAAIDWDRDGTMDLLARDTSGTMKVYRGYTRTAPDGQPMEGRIVDEEPSVVGRGWNVYSNITAQVAPEDSSRFVTYAVDDFGELRSWNIHKDERKYPTRFGERTWAGLKLAH